MTTPPLSRWDKVTRTAGLFWHQRGFIYQPPLGVLDDASTLPLIRQDRRRWSRGWVLNPGQRQALILFAGNTDDILEHRDWVQGAFPKHTLYLMPYRGYSGQAGLPTEKAIKRDACELVRHVGKTHGQIDVLGRSLGTGVAIHVAAKLPSLVSRLTLLTPYDSLLAIAQERFPWAPVKWFLKDRFDSVRDAPQVHCPTLVLTAGQDSVVPASRARALLPHLAATQVLEHVHVERATHRSICWHPASQVAMRRFFQVVEAPQNPQDVVNDMLERIASTSSTLGQDRREQEQNG